MARPEKGISGAKPVVESVSTYPEADKSTIQYDKQLANELLADGVGIEKGRRRWQWELERVGGCVRELW